MRFQLGYPGWIGSVKYRFNSVQYFMHSTLENQSFLQKLIYILFYRLKSTGQTVRGKHVPQKVSQSKTVTILGEAISKKYERLSYLFAVYFDQHLGGCTHQMLVEICFFLIFLMKKVLSNKK